MREIGAKIGALRAEGDAALRRLKLFQSLSTEAAKRRVRRLALFIADY